ncbi:hypothetical protein ACFVIM_34825 [Streptomyces sp. NPDC057638]|uniref:hypothetical protein n=1 Tax=Streptomyces sp. NPDC057638 TaxID=3346190 RepID=UPI00367A8DF3
MAGRPFSQVATGPTLDAAFREAVAEAQREYGAHSYSGTIGMKQEVTLIDEPPREEGDARLRVERLLDLDDSRIRNKWGPAGALPLHPVGGCPAWLLFGWAAS